MNHRHSLNDLADHLQSRREVLLRMWRDAIRRDPELGTNASLPRVQLNDHVPGILAAFGERLRQSFETAPVTGAEVEATAHGVHRWQQGYDLYEVTRELGVLNSCMVTELDSFAREHVDMPSELMSFARQAWAAQAALTIEESTSQYFQLQRIEASGHVQDLEAALDKVNELDRQRAELWRQIAHDLRGNVGVVTTAAKGLALSQAAAQSRERFLKILELNLGSLKHLLDDVTSLTRLQAGTEARQITQFDLGDALRELCESFQGFAEEHGLYLRASGPAPFVVSGDRVKIHRLTQNLVLNALRYTVAGGVTVTWRDTDASDDERWELEVADTGPGVHAGPGSPLASAMQGATDLAQEVGGTTAEGTIAGNQSEGSRHDSRPAHVEHGEGIGLSIVKRLADLLDASIELRSEKDVGTTFRILLPKTYDD